MKHFYIIGANEFFDKKIDSTFPDLIEFNGKTYILYMTGNQSTYARLTYATFPGTLSQLASVYQQ